MRCLEKADVEEAACTNRQALKEAMGERVRDSRGTNTHRENTVPGSNMAWHLINPALQDPEASLRPVPFFLEPSGLLFLGSLMSQ